MAIFKCKMCGGTLEINNNETVAVCEYCGTKQTLPKSNDEVVSNLFNRANNLRLKCEFDKAEQVYEKILEIDNTEAEAHWGIVLCKYGIEYVEDPKTYTRIPTCHRTSYDSILADSAYLSAIANADGYQKVIYEEEAKKINEIQRGILSIVKNEKPFDVFICYKETDENGQRTVDSTIANDIYHQLTNEGFKVFYSAITLEDKLGEAYEPYIFAALNSAKVMLVIGTKPEYFEAVWVKNEWSRFLKLIKTDRSKLLIPCYRNMDAYDLPEEFSHLQSQDMSKIGFINDIERGIKKVLAKDTEKAEPVVVSQAISTANVAPLLKRAYLFLEDGDFESANEYCEKVLDADPENARAYLGKTLVALKLSKVENLAKSGKEYFTNKDYEKAVRFADEKLKEELEQYLTAWKDNQYDVAVKILNRAKTASEYRVAAESFRVLYGYKDSQQQRTNCIEQAERLDNLTTEHQNLLLKINDKKKQLSDLKIKRQKIESDYLNKKNTLDELSKKRSAVKPLSILTISNLLLPFLFMTIIMNSGEEMSDFTAIVALLIMMAILVSYIAFIIIWIKISKNVLNRKKNDIVSNTVIAIVFPFIACILALVDCGKINKLRCNSKDIEKQVQDYLVALSHCQDEITVAESEIQQLTMQANQLADVNGLSQNIQINDTSEKKDELLVQAIDVVVEMQSASITLLQRKLKLGYARAARMLETLEEIGIVGPFVESQPRQVLISQKQWKQMKNNY